MPTIEEVIAELPALAGGPGVFLGPGALLYQFHGRGQRRAFAGGGEEGQRISVALSVALVYNLYVGSNPTHAERLPPPLLSVGGIKGGIARLNK